MKKIDMSSEAISIRLKQVDQIRYLCVSLMKAKKKPKKIVESAKTEKSSIQSV
jgi:hypothetical protein